MPFYIQAEFERVSCIPNALIEVSVRQGEVELRVVMTNERERNAVHVAVENVPGVKAIDDHLSLVKPLSGLVLLTPEDDAAERTRA